MASNYVQYFAIFFKYHKESHSKHIDVLLLITLLRDDWSWSNQLHLPLIWLDYLLKSRRAACEGPVPHFPFWGVIIPSFEFGWLFSLETVVFFSPLDRNHDKSIPSLLFSISKESNPIHIPVKSHHPSNERKEKGSDVVVSPSPLKEGKEKTPTISCLGRQKDLSKSIMLYRDDYFLENVL